MPRQEAGDVALLNCNASLLRNLVLTPALFGPRLRKAVRAAPTAAGVISLAAWLAAGAGNGLAQQTAVCSDTPAEGERIECTEPSTSSTDINLSPSKSTSIRRTRTATALVAFMKAAATSPSTSVTAWLKKTEKPKSYSAISAQRGELALAFTDAIPAPACRGGEPHECF